MFCNFKTQVNFIFRFIKLTGSLLKCNSFSTLNSKPKVKHVEMTVLQKQKQTGEPGSLDNKEGTFRTLSKSMSLRPPILNRSSAPESKVKRLSPKFSHVQDVKGSKHAKDQNIFERKNSFKSDVGSSKAVSSTLSPPRHDQKTLQAEGKLLISKPSNHLVQKGSKFTMKILIFVFDFIPFSFFFFSAFSFFEITVFVTLQFR